MRNFLKKEDSNKANLQTDELIARFRGKKLINAKTAGIALSLFAMVLVVCLSFALKSIKFNEDTDTLISLSNISAAAADGKKDLISIPAGTVKANPFLPYRNIGGDSSLVDDVPRFDLIEPPESVNVNSDAARVMDTIVSGILYDKYSPSAIINIEGNDYLVKKGDVVNSYKILNIAQDSVTVTLGGNTYKAGIGEILTEGNVNYNEVSNLSKKFGGEKR